MIAAACELRRLWIAPETSQMMEAFSGIAKVARSGTYLSTILLAPVTPIVAV
jgi:hypothetical protein